MNEGLRLRQALIITDSIGAPRDLPLTNYQDTWVSQIENFLLANYQMKCFSYTQRAADTNHVVHRIKVQLQFYQPELVVLQLGICDCAPRVLKEKELRFIQKLPIIRKIIHKFISANYAKLSQKRNLAYVEKDVFVKNLQSIKASFLNAKIVIIPIGLPNDEYKRKSPKIEERIRDYNQALKSVFSDNDSFYLEEFTQITQPIINDIYAEDNYHLIAKSHSMLFECLQEKITKDVLLNK